MSVVYGTCPMPSRGDHRVFGMRNVTLARRTSPRAGLHGGRRKAHNRSAIPGPALRPALHGEVACARPTGEDMVVPLETSRNAQPDKVKAAPNAVGKGEIGRPRPV